MDFLSCRQFKMLNQSVPNTPCNNCGHHYDTEKSCLECDEYKKLQKFVTTHEKIIFGEYAQLLERQSCLKNELHEVENKLEILVKDLLDELKDL